jgi:excisionase family DNA binding protein
MQAAVERLLTLPQVADRLSVSTASVRHWITTGELEGIRLGDSPLARYRVPEGAIDKFIRAAGRSGQAA